MYFDALDDWAGDSNAVLQEDMCLFVSAALVDMQKIYPTLTIHLKVQQSLLLHLGLKFNQLNRKHSIKNALLQEINANYYTISIEFEDYEPNGGAGNITEGQINSGIRLINHVNKQYNLSIPPDRLHYMGHREVSNTYCPGDHFPYNRIIAGLDKSGSSGVVRQGNIVGQ